MAISSVVVLFKVVTAYGETNLKAPPAIGGPYRISTQNLPGCLKANRLVLNIKQSSIYLFGSLLPNERYRWNSRRTNINATDYGYN